MSNNYFERASKQKLRFSTTRGKVTAEDLWDLSLNDLNSVAISVNKIIKGSDEESFISKASVKVTDELRANNLRLDVVKHVIGVKIATEASAEKRLVTKAKRERLLALKAKIEDDELLASSKEDIDAMLAELDE